MSIVSAPEHFVCQSARNLDLMRPLDISLGAKEIYARTVSKTAFGYFAATQRSTRAAPSGLLLPCSQLRSVAGLIPSSSANFCCVSPRCRRIADTFGLSIRNSRPGAFLPRKTAPPCSMLVSNSSNVSFFIGAPLRQSPRCCCRCSAPLL